MNAFIRMTLITAVGLGVCGAAFAANFNVTTPADFQAALTTAQSNGQNDTINVGVCSGTGCSGGVYNITTPLTYTAAASESFSLTIDGFDSDTRILNGGSAVSILRIDTTAASDGGTTVAVRNMTLVNGNASGVPSDGGAVSVLVGGANVEITGSVYLDNAADDDGGAVFIRATDFAEAFILIQDVTFDGNTARGIAGDGTGDGGSVHISANASDAVSVIDVDLNNSQAQGNGGGIEIEGLDPTDPAQARVTQVSFFDVGIVGNTAQGNGGGAAVAANAIELDRMGFVDNVAVRGGGLHVRRDFFSFQMINAGFLRNSASENGGGLAIDQNMGAIVTAHNNTIYNNSAAGSGGGAFVSIGGSTGTARLYNNIIYNNTDATSGRDIFIDNDPFSDIPATVQFFNNDITDLTGFPGSSTVFGITSAAELSADRNIDDAPILPNIDNVLPDPSQGALSPTIDAGENDPPGIVPLFDFEGDTRPQDGDGDMEAIIDIGMDEFVGGAVASADLGVTKTDSPDPVVGGETLTYTVSVANAGPDTATGVTVVDTLDAAVTFVSASFPQGTACTTAGTPVVVTCILGDVSASGAVIGTIVVTAPMVVDVGSVTNEVTVDGNEADPDLTDNTDSEGTTVVPPGPAMADLAISKTDAPDPVFSGGQDITYTLTVDNNGPDTATGVTLTDTLPAGVSFQSASASAGTCGTPDGAGVLSCDLGTLPPTNNATITIVVTPDVVAEPTDIVNNAAVTANEDDPVPGNNSAATTTTVNAPAADMLVSITSTPDVPLINESITYTVTITNNGPSDNSNVDLSVTLPSGVTFGSVASDQGSCAEDTGVVTCMIGNIADGETVTITVVVTAPGTPTTLAFTAEVTGDVADPQTDNNSLTDELDVIDTIDIVIRGEGGTGSFGLTDLLMLCVATCLLLTLRMTARRKRAATTLAAAFLAATLVLMLPSGNAQAQQDWYAGASIGASDAGYSAGELTSDLAARGWSISNVDVDDTDTAYKIYGGFMLTDNFAVEGGYIDLGEVTTQFGTSIPPTQINTLLNDTLAVHPYLGDGWFAAAVFTWPIVPQQFSLNARAGVFAWEADIDVEVIQGATGSASDGESGTDAMYGVGVEWHINPQWSVTADWERYRLNDWVDVPMIGVRFRF